MKKDYEGRFAGFGKNPIVFLLFLPKDDNSVMSEVFT